MVAAVIVNLGVTALNILCAHAGAGKHIGTLSTTLELFSKVSCALKLEYSTKTLTY